MGAKGLPASINQIKYIMKVLIKERHFVDRFSCNDIYREHTITRMEERGDMYQLYNGTYPYMSVPKSDVIVRNS